jgi:uncharacterized protein YwgA
MPPAQVGREEQMLAFFVKHCGGRIGRTQLMKFLYLADYEARRFLGRPISSVEYVWYHYGPYDHGLNDRIALLEREGIIREEPLVYPTGKQGFIYHGGEREVAFTLADEELRLLDYVCETYSRIGLQSLLDDVVYETEPMQKARAQDARNEPLDMSIADDQRRFDLGVPYEEVMKRSGNARAGRSVDHAEAMAMIRKALGDAAA